MSEVVVIYGVCQTDFYNQKFFEDVSYGIHKNLKLFKNGKYEYVGVQIDLSEEGRVTPETITQAYEKLEGTTLLGFDDVFPKVFLIGG